MATISEPQQRDLFTGRYRKVKGREPSELQIQIALIERLHLLARKGVVYFHVPNGELRDPRLGAKFKAMGELPGVSDLIFFVPADNPMLPMRVLCLELKAPGRKQTDNQIHFEKIARYAGAIYRCVDNLDDAVNFLQTYGVLP